MLVPTRRYFVWSDLLNWMLAGILLSQMIVDSFQPTFTKNFRRKRHRPKHIYTCTTCKNNPPWSNSRVQSDGALHSTEDGHDDSILDRTRRDLISLGPALGIALSLLDQPLEANAAADVTHRNAATAADDVSNIIPFSSVRRMKTITLSNGLRVLLVNDKRALQSTAALIVDGVGQFTDPDELPGLAHLMEHMILSSNNDSKFGKRGDLEDWLADNGGTSNAFTAYQQTCFHFNCPHDALSRALDRFSRLFVETNVIHVCRNAEILKREIRRVDSELDLDSTYAQLEYVTKSFVNPEHPYSKFSRGNLASLETKPNEKGVNVSERLVQFFRQYYVSSKSVLVVVSNQLELSSIERWVAPFSMSLKPRQNQVASNVMTNYVPGQFLRGKRHKHLILYQKDESLSSIGNEKLIMQWVLNEDYRGTKKNNAAEIAFVLNQVLGRRGPGSLYLFLRKRGWIQNKSSTLPLQIKVPTNVSGFQLLRLELSLTIEGFLNRSRIVAAIYDSIDAIRNPGTDLFVIPREIMAQYATTAKLFGYILAPRPPDAVELAMDSMSYGIDTVQSGRWYRFTSTEDLGGLALNRMRRTLSSALSKMSDPEEALIIITAGDKALTTTQSGIGNEPIPSLSSSKWKRECITGARIYFEEMLPLKSRVEQAVLTKIISKEELLPPVYNPFVLTSLRPPRASDKPADVPGTRPDTSTADRKWSVLKPGQIRMHLPRIPPEASCRCAFVLQLLSPRPARASAEQAANAELWRLTFDEAAKDLAELGAPGGLAYELKFNKYGLRISCLGLSQTIPSYVRRLTQLLAKHQQNLFKSQKTLSQSLVSSAVADANRARSLSPARKSIIVNTLQKSTSYDVASEGCAFLRSCTSGVCFSEGDLTSNETESLLDNVQFILKDSVGATSIKDERNMSTIPSVEDLVDAPNWKPRNASPCFIPGVSLMSDVCGRIPR